MDTTKGKLSVGNRVVFCPAFSRTGIVTEADVKWRGRLGEYHKIKGENGWDGDTLPGYCVIRIPSEEEVIVSKAELEELREDSRFLSRLEAAGVDKWDGYYFACAKEASDFE